MRKFLWLNPVVVQMYGGPDLENELTQRGYELVFCQQDPIADVKEKYAAVIQKAHTCVADMRCPMAVDYIKETYAPDFLEYPDIEPILLHCARELHTSCAPLGELWVVTPCAALSELGNRLSLSAVTFCTWRDFARQEHLAPPKKQLLASPIPPGFFAEYGSDALVLNSREEIDRYFSSLPHSSKKVAELLYCPFGCHNGDGV